MLCKPIQHQVGSAMQTDTTLSAQISMPHVINTPHVTLTSHPNPNTNPIPNTNPSPITNTKKEVYMDTCINIITSSLPLTLPHEEERKLTVNV